MRNKLLQPAALLLLEIMSVNLVVPALGAAPAAALPFFTSPGRHNSLNVGSNKVSGGVMPPTTPMAGALAGSAADGAAGRLDNGGPSQPEMSSFKPAGADNLVNLFTGDFSYNIPLLDVGGYPVNIFYDGNLSPEQDASWVGLGWNINPGSITRNLRGVPDDFSGEEKLIQEQDMKPNKTWGVDLGLNFELLGVKALRGNVSMGFVNNNYLGPALQQGIGVHYSLNLLTLARQLKFPEGLDTLVFSAKVSGGLSANMSSRSGFTVTPQLSLDAGIDKTGNLGNAGLGISTSYNSRSGIQALNFSSNLGPASVYDRSISFLKPSFIPQLRVSTTTSSFSGRFALGPSKFSAYFGGNVNAYGSMNWIAPAQRRIDKPMIGYLYAGADPGLEDAIQDVTRFNDQEVRHSTPAISVPSYTYDIFNVQGEGGGGTVRLYRNDVGFTTAPKAQSKNRSLTAGADLSIWRHWGVNNNDAKIVNTSGAWSSGNLLRQTTAFKTDEHEWKAATFRNPNENAQIAVGDFDKIGGTDLVRYKLAGTAINPAVTSALLAYDTTLIPKATISIGDGKLFPAGRKRNQVVSFLNASEASHIGLERKLYSYQRNHAGTIIPANGTLDNLVDNSMDRNSGYRKNKHISEVTILEEGGRRLVYGLPAYNVIQKEYLFSTSSQPDAAGMVVVGTGETSLASGLLNAKGIDGFVNITTTPAYAHSFLITGALSPDYVDVTGNGITEDDIGTGVRFNYSYTGIQKWRTPLSGGRAFFNDGGTATSPKDDKGVISYGERENWHLHSVEGKTMIALFFTSNRKDAKNIVDSSGTVASPSSPERNVVKKLDSIKLFNKADLVANGLSGASPVKTVYFSYSYELSKHFVGNYETSGDSTGKLTLKSISFSFGKAKLLKRSKYSFGYGQGTNNPDYVASSTDRWGSYKPVSRNPAGIPNQLYPYVDQSPNRENDASAWMLKSIVTPAGGKIDLEFESDDYAYVQNRQACAMMPIAGFSNSTGGYNNRLYEGAFNVFSQFEYVFVKVPVACTDAAQVYQRYLKGLEQIALNVSVNMPKGAEQIRCYAKLEAGSYGVFSGDNTNKTIYFKLQKIEGSYSPVFLSALEFLRQRLPGQAFPGYDLSDEQGIRKVAKMMTAMYSSLKEAFRNPIKVFMSKGYAKTVNTSRSFVRLNEPYGFKKGGQTRVRSVTFSDNWNQMTGQASASYGQTYDYTTIDEATGNTISSGVATYEPSIGAEENPFTSIALFSDKNPAAPTTYGAVEMPVMDALFPAATIGYSKVTVRSLRKVKGGKLARSAGGKQVTEYYTARDYPVKYAYTPLGPDCDWRFTHHNTRSFFRSSSVDMRTLSQGFLVTTNDMHGQLKTQALFNQNDSLTPHHLTQYYYSNTGVKGLAQTYKFITPQGEVQEGVRGIDVELMTDMREYRENGWTDEKQMQIDVVFIFPIPTIWPVKGELTSVYREVTATKMVTYRAIVDSVVVTDKGNTVSTANLAYDSETGSVLVTQTNNAFDKPVYNVTYPAHWLYPVAANAYRNIDMTTEKVNIHNGVIMNAPGLVSKIESGDVFYVMHRDSRSTFCQDSPPTPDSVRKLWAVHTGKNTSPFYDYRAYGELRLVDRNGVPYNRDSVSLRVVRSGYRNTPSIPVQTITTMSKPFLTASGLERLSVNNTTVLQGSAVEMGEKWLVDKSVVHVGELLSSSMGDDAYVCGSQWFRIMKINPYNTGSFGILRLSKQRWFAGDRLQAPIASQPDLSTEGTLVDFEPYFNFHPTTHQFQPLTTGDWRISKTVTHYHRNGAPIQAKDARDIHQATKFDLGDNFPSATALNASAGEVLFLDFDSHSNATFHNESCTETPYYRYSGQNMVGSTSDPVAHTGKDCLKLDSMYTAVSSGNTFVYNTYGVVTRFKAEQERNNNLQFTTGTYGGYGCGAKGAIVSDEYMFNPYFEVKPGKQYRVSCWVKEKCGDDSDPCKQLSYDNIELHRGVVGGGDTSGILGAFYTYEVLKPSGPIIDGWQKLEGIITAGPRQTIGLFNLEGKITYLDDLRIYPADANMRTMVYDPITHRLIAELDENNFATFYEYDLEGVLIRKKKETAQGIKTLIESRSATQSVIQN